MPTYNTLVTEWEVRPNEICTIHIQFSYGDCWLYEYQLGDTLKWGGNDNGKPDAKSVVVLGILEWDDQQRFPYLYSDFEIYIIDNVIDRVTERTDKYDWVNAPYLYIILD